MASRTLAGRIKERSLLSLWWLFIGTSAVWLAVGSVAYWVKKGWLPPDASGWVQALGAITAIGVAIAVPYYQAMAARESAREQEFLVRKRAMDAVRALISHQEMMLSAVERIRKTSKTALGGFEGELILQRLEQNDAEMSKIALDTFGSRYVPCVLEVKAVAAFARLAGGFDAMRYTTNSNDIERRINSSKNLMRARTADLILDEENLFAEFGRPYN